MNTSTTDSHRWIDLRSDTVTQPGEGMRDAMCRARVGDDVYGEDPTVNALEEKLATMTGLQAGLFLPSGTQSNLAALLTHCGRGDEYIAGQLAHAYRYEGGGAAALGGIQPQPLEFNSFGGLDLQQVEAVIKPLDSHFARSRLLCLENTVHGKVLPLDYMEQARALVDRHGLQLHLDGARVFNAVTALGCSLKDITRFFDSVSICLSKGLGTPAGSVLLGSQSFIEEARRWRKVLGGGMRQAGILAAAGVYALEHNIERLAEDHRRAGWLAEELRTCGFPVQAAQSNMVFVDLSQLVPHRVSAEDLEAQLRRHRIRADFHDPRAMRLVAHLDITDEDIHTVIQAFKTLQ